MKNPGWIDLQVNGCLGVDFSDATLTEEQFLRCAEWMLGQGTEVFLPTIITSTWEIYRRNGELIRRAVEGHGLKKHIPGLHLEGPFLNPAPGAIGAHNPAWTQPASAEAVRKLHDYCGGFLCLMTLGAEVPGADEAIAEARRLKIIPSVGHHLATSEDVRKAADAGALNLTHLGNGCPGMLDRHHNPIWSGLGEDRLTAMIITDGQHIPPELIKTFIRTKGVEHIIVTSDAASVAGLPPGKYRLAGNDGVLEPSGKFWNPSKNCLIGASAPIAQCMEYLDSLQLVDNEQLVKLGRANALSQLRTICGYPG
ncbi:MAG: hypothetical protein J5654_00295 [Victivallales bacterium]|nr:hypothetical protein [Victivallales bacterium]